MWENLRNLNEDTLRAELGDYLRGTEIEGLLKRRALLIKHIEGLIEQRGEKVVLFEFRPATKQMASTS